MFANTLIGNFDNMDKEQLLLRFFEVVARSLRHKHYAHVNAKHKKYMQLVAGVGLDEMLKQYVSREDTALFNQRKILTKHIVTSVSKNLLDVFYKVPRANSARRVLTYSGNGGDKLTAELEDILSKFWGHESWDDYMATRYVELNSVDPNAFVVFEFKPFDNRVKLVQPYPFEVSSKNAIDYKLNNKVLEYLISENGHTYKKHQPIKQTNTLKDSLLKDNKDYVKGKKYTLYGKNQTFQLLQIDSDSVANKTQYTTEAKIIKEKKKFYVRLGDAYYQFIEHKAHNCDAVPAIRIGYYRDLETGGETFVNQLHAVEPYLEKTVKANSELDIVAARLAFPQMIKIGEPCVDINCNVGFYENGDTCSTCKGWGFRPTAPSTQDAIVIRKPKHKEDFIPLDQYIKYLHPPVEIVKWQEQYIENLTQKAKRTMFNSDNFTKRQVQKTATGENLDMQNVYDTLHPFAVRFSRGWVHGVKIMAKLADRAKNLVCTHTFGKDFKLKSLDTLIVSLSVVNGLNMPVLSRNLMDDIALIIFSEKPTELKRYTIKEFYNPFAGKSEKEITMLMSSDLVSVKEKTLHANYGRIFDELELEHANEGKDFYKLNRTLQRAAIYKKVDEIIAQIKAENPAPVLEI